MVHVSAHWEESVYHLILTVIVLPDNRSANSKQTLLSVLSIANLKLIRAPVRESTGALGSALAGEGRETDYPGCPSVRFLEACCHVHEALSQEARSAEGERQLRELVRHGFHDVLLADPLEAAGAAKSVQRARELTYDAVHMKPAGYAALAGRIRELTQQWLFARKRKGDPMMEPAARGRKRTRMQAHPAARAGPRRLGRARRGATQRRGKGRVPPPGGKITSIVA